MPSGASHSSSNQPPTTAPAKPITGQTRKEAACPASVRNASPVFVRSFGMKIFHRRINTRFAHCVKTRRVPGHGVGKVEILHFMMHGEDQQKRRIRCSERVTAAESHGMRENHPPLARMNQPPTF